MAKTSVVPLHETAFTPPSHIKLTVNAIAGLKPRDKRYLVYDTQVKGLAVRVFPSGAKSYYLYSRIGKGRSARKVNVTLGSTDIIRLDAARKLARKRLADMSEGVNPNTRKEASADLSTLLDAYEERLKARGVVKRADTMSALRRNLKAHLSHPAEDLTRKHIVARMDKLEAEGKQGAASYLRKCVTAFFNWAVNADLLKANVMAGYRRERQTKAELIERPKITLTTDAEIRAFWEATANLSPVFRDYCRMLLLNGGRRTETAKMEWSQINDDAWACPAIQTKMGREHRVPLGPMSRALLEAQPRYNATNLVFPGRDFQPMSGWTQRLRPLKEQLSEPAFGQVGRTRQRARCDPPPGPSLHAWPAGGPAHAR